MTRLEWGKGPRPFDYGVDRGVLYLDEGAVPWNGLVSVDEVASGEMDVDHYFEGNRVHISHENGYFEGQITAFTYPDVFAEYNGFSDVDEYRRFGFSYRNRVGPSEYQLHIVYNVLVRDDSRTWRTIGNRPDPSLFSWAISAATQEIPGASPASRLMLEAPRDPDVLSAIEDILYGTDTEDPRLPTPEEIVDAYEATTIVKVVYNGDGSYTISGPDEFVGVPVDGVFQLDVPTAFLINHDIFTVRSY